MAVPYSALLISDDIDDEAEDPFDFDLTNADTLETVEALIQEVTGIMEGASGLNRNLIVREYTHYVDYRDWDYSQSRDLWYIFAPQWPVVEIDTSGFTIGTSTTAWQNEQDLILYTSRFSGAVNYYAGYKRAEQSLSDLQSAGLTNLGTAPGDLPYDIRSAAINGVMQLLAERRQGPGQRTRVLNPAVQSTTIDEIMVDYIRKVVKSRIYHHRRVV